MMFFGLLTFWFCFGSRVDFFFSLEIFLSVGNCLGCNSSSRKRFQPDIFQLVGEIFGEFLPCVQLYTAWFSIIEVSGSKLLVLITSSLCFISERLAHLTPILSVDGTA